MTKCQLCGCLLENYSKRKQGSAYVNEQGLTVCEWCYNYEIIGEEDDS